MFMWDISVQMESQTTLLFIPDDSRKHNEYILHQNGGRGGGHCCSDCLRHQTHELPIFKHFHKFTVLVMQLSKAISEQMCWLKRVGQQAIRSLSTWINSYLLSQARTCNANLKSSSLRELLSTCANPIVCA